MLKKLRYLKYYTKVLLNNWTVQKDSYAQHEEDKLIELLLQNGVNSFIDIGANDGVLFSNTYKFAKSGARGLCVEPSRKSLPKLYLNHLFHFKVRCIHGAVSSSSGHIFIKEDGYESTLSKVQHSPSVDATKVRAYTLNDLFIAHPRFKKVDLLSIDVEGHEKSVLLGAKEPIQAKIIIIETDKLGIDTLNSLPALKAHRPSYTNGINMILTLEGFDLPKKVKIPKGFSPC